MSFSSERRLPTLNLFLDTNIIVDYIIPSERAKYGCSQKLVEKIGKGDFKAWSADYALSETLGKLKENREKSLGVRGILRETLSTHEIEEMTRIIETFRKTPNFEIFEVEPIK